MALVKIAKKDPLHLSGDLFLLDFNNIFFSGLHTPGL